MVRVGQRFGHEHPIGTVIISGSHPAGFIFFPLIMPILIKEYSWRGAILILAGFTLNIVPLGLLATYGNFYYFLYFILLWTPTYGRAKAGWPARTYIQQLCEDTGCSPEDLPEARNNREKWRERVRDIRASGTTWWWWFLINVYINA